MAQDIKTVEVGGYKLTVDMDAFDDVRFFEMSEQVEEHPKLFIDILKMAAGEAEYSKMEKHFVKKDGRFKMNTVIEAVNKVLDITDPKGGASGQSESSTQTN